MKLSKVKYKAQPVTYIVIATISVYFIVYGGPVLIKAAALNFYFLFLILLINLRHSSLPLKTANATSMPTLYWLGLITLVQIGFWLIFLGVFASINLMQPLPVTPMLDDASNTQTCINIFMQSGFIPWTMFLVLILSLIRHISPQNMHLVSPAITPIIKKPKSILTYLTDFYFKQGFLIIISTTIAIYTLALTQLIASAVATPITYGFNFTTLIIATLFYLLMATRSWYKIIQYFQKHYITAGIALLSLTVFVMLFIIMINTGMHWLGKFFTLNFEFPNLLSPIFSNRLYPNLWILFTFYWWVGWAPILATYIAQISQGRGIRSICCGILFLPLCITLLLLLWPRSINALSLKSVQVISCCIGFICLSATFIYFKTLNQFIFNLDVYHPIKKIRRRFKQLRMLLQATLITLTLSISLGTNVVIAFALIMVLPCIVIFFLIGIALYKDLQSQQKHISSIL